MLDGCGSPLPRLTMTKTTSKPGAGHRTNTTPIPFGFYPWWFWNDDLQPDEMRRQIAEMADKGAKGIYIIPRQGLAQAYLSDAYFDCVELAIDVAAEHELQIHFLDENPYPSGTGGSEVMEGRPEFFATRLEQRTYDLEGGQVRLALDRGKVLCCRAYPLTASGEVDWAGERDLIDAVGIVLPDESFNEVGLTAYNRKRYFASQPTPTLQTELPAGRWRVFVSVQIVVEDHKYWRHFVDVMNPEAMREFLRVTHDRYAARVGQHFGSVFLSFFADETCPTWSACLPERFLEAYGYELIDMLPALQDRSHPKHIQVARNLQDLKYEIFCDTFERPVRDWCAAHGLRYSAEKPTVRLAQMAFIDLPGCEPGHTKAGSPMDLLGPINRGNARATASGAYFYGKEGSLCECYHSMGWSATLQDAKLIAEALTLMGTHCIMPHAFFYSTHAMRKHDAPPSFFFQMPYWPLFGQLTGRIDALGRHFEGTHIDARVLVVDPSPGLPTEEDHAAYVSLQEVLMAEHVDFLTVDTDILKGAAIEAGEVVVRDIRAAMVIVPPMQDVEQELEDWLATYLQKGGRVIRCAADLDTDALRREILATVQPSLLVGASEGNAGAIQMVTRRGDGRRLWFLLNPSADPVTLTFNTDEDLREQPLEEGEPALLERTDDGFVRELRAFESVLLLGERDGHAAIAEAELLPRVAINVGGSCKVTPRRPNVLRLGDWEMCLVDPQGNDGMAGQVGTMPLPNQLSKTGIPFSPVFEEEFGCLPELRLPPLHARYRATFDNAYDGAVDLLMEPGSIAGDWTITLNGSEITGADLAHVDAFVPGCLGCGITSQLRRGTNTIVIDLRSDRLDGGLVNPLYLQGEFGVLHDVPRLVARSADGEFDDYEGNALPFYSGTIDYECSIDLKRPPSGDAAVELVFDRPFEDACEVSFNGGSFLPVLWSPRRVIVPGGQLREGANDVRMRVYTSMIRTFEGQVFDIEAHATRRIGDRGEPGDGDGQPAPPAAPSASVPY